MKIGQISFFEMTTPADRPYGASGLGSKYRGQRGPTPSRYSENFKKSESRRRGASKESVMLARIIVGLALTVVVLRHRRAALLVVVATHPQRSRPRRDAGRAFDEVGEAELVEVAGQRKLLHWTVPGLAHFFTMWGFTVLMTTIIEAYGALFNRDFHIPLIGRSNWLAFVEDFFATAVLVSLVVFSIIRWCKSAFAQGPPEPLLRLAHLGAAWAVLVMISLVIVTLLVYRGRRSTPVTSPSASCSTWAFAHATSWLRHRGWRPLGAASTAVLEAVFLLANIGVITGFLVFVAYSKHLHIFLAPINIGVSRRPRALGGLDKTPDMDMENVTEDTVFGVGHVEDFTWKQMLDFATCTECGRCQSVCPAWTTGKPLSPEAPHHGPAREHVRLGRPAALGRAPRATSRRWCPPTIDPDVLWSLHHVRQLRRAVPGRHRARRRHHRHAPLRGADGVAFPHRGRPAACATWRTRATRGAWARPSAPTG